MPTTNTLLRQFRWKTDGWVIGIALVAPTVMTWLYFFVLAGQGMLTRVVYFTSKVLTGLLPLYWYLILRFQVMRESEASDTPLLKPRHLLSFKLGLDFGLFTVAGMMVLYYVWLRDLPLFKSTADLVHAKLLDAGVTSPTAFVVMAGFLTIIHSAFEEYYWRWFVFGRLRAGIPWMKAALVSSFGFMLHHILVLYTFLPGEAGLLFVVVFSICIGIGGFVWCCIYQHTGSLLGAWVAHLCADLGIMWCGYDIVASKLG
ncbi:MAG: CPBP family intramembrane glutamic endopeptidase [Gemmatales bacterium]